MGAHQTKVKAARNGPSTTPGSPKSKSQALESFVAEMVKHMLEKAVEDVVEDSKTGNMPNGGPKTTVNATEGIITTVAAKNNDHLQGEVPGELSSDSSLSRSPSTSPSSSSSSSSPLDEITDTLSTTPSVGISADNAIGLIVNTPARVGPLFHEAMQFFWNLRTITAPGTFEEALRKAQYPPRFSPNCFEEEDLVLGKTADDIVFLNRSLFFDYIRETLQQIYEGEDEDVRLNRKPVVSSTRYRLWNGPRRPNSLPVLENLVRRNIETELGICVTFPPRETNGRSTAHGPTPPILSDIDRLPKLSQWTIKRKDWLDQRLEVEMRADEASWLNYRPFELKLIDNLTSKILMENFDEVFKRCVAQMELDSTQEEEEEEEEEKGEPTPPIDNFENGYYHGTWDFMEETKKTIRVRNPSSISD